MKYFIIAGELSGDLHGSNLVREIIRIDQSADIKCWGGDLMESAGATLLMHYRNTAFMGFVSVLRNLGTIKRNLAICRQQLTGFMPDVVILIDYPGFNLRIAGFAKSLGLRVFYYISPKFWAWNEGRVEKVRRFVDRMYIIFPFERGFYKKHGIDAIYCGNPILDETERKLNAIPPPDQLKESLIPGRKPVIALLAGSRKSEVRYVLPKMIEVVDDFPEHQFVLAGVKHIPDDLYSRIIGRKQVILLKDKTYELLRISQAALVTSGTATLETALFNIPQVVCFRGDFFSMIIAWMVIKVKYISLVNLIAGKEVVRELVQYDLNRNNLRSELKLVLPGGEKFDTILADYKNIREMLGEPGASARVAGDMVSYLRQNSNVESKE